MKKNITKIILIFFLLSLAFPGTAERVIHDSPTKLDGAIEAWLDDKDEIALPLLSELAHSSNEDAMLMLGQLEKRPGRPSPYMASLTPQELAALLKAPGRFSGTSWLKKVKQQKPLAEALQHHTGNKARLAAIETLLNHGEAGQALLLMQRQLYYGDYVKLLEISQRHELPPEANLTLWLAAFHMITDTRETDQQHYAKQLLTRAMGAVSRKQMFGYIFVRATTRSLNAQRQYKYTFNIGAVLNRGEFWGYPERPADKWGILPQTWEEKQKINNDAAEIVLRTSQMQPLVRFCEKFCRQSVKMCTRTMLGAVDGYYGFLQLQSPLEKLIPRPTYLQSKRFEADLTRAASKFSLDLMRTHPDKTDACAAKLLLSAN